MTQQSTEGQQQAQSQGDTGQQPTAQTPPWGTDEQFDAAKAWKLIQDLRSDKEKLSSRPVLDDAAKAKLDEYDQLKAASQTDLERAQGEMTRWQTEAEKWRAASVSSTIKALAATDFEYPDDAVGALDPSKYLDAGGTIDEQAIKTDLNALLDARPKWRRGESDTQTPRAPRPSTAQGASNGQASSDPAQQFASIMQAALK